MARYEDDGIEFAQQQFARARDYREEQAKKQEQFAKRLQMANLAVSGINFAINQKADALELSQAPKRGAYLSTLESAKSFRAGEDARRKSGQSVEGYLTNKYYEQIKASIAEMSPNAVASEYQPIAMQKAKELALTSKGEYENVLKMSNQLNFEDFEEYYKQSAKIPRNIGSWLGSKVQNFMKGETEETIKLRNERAKDALAGTTMGDAFKDADVAIRAYDAHTDLGNVALDIVKNLTRGARTEGQTKEMIGSEGYGLYYIQQEADPLGKKPPQIITTKIGGIYNKEGELTFTQKVDFLKLIKDDKELQDEIQQAFKDDPTGTKALDIASRDPQKYYKIDFADEAKREELFELRYQSMASTRPDLFILRDGKHKPRTGKPQEIIDLGLDRDTLRLEFNQRIEDGLKLGQGELDTVGLKNVASLVPEAQKQNFINLFDADNSEFNQLFGAEISQSDSPIVNLGSYDLNQVFPNMGLTGTYELIWDTTSKNLLFK
jgi:hypothetical protein